MRPNVVYNLSNGTKAELFIIPISKIFVNISQFDKFLEKISFLFKQMRVVVENNPFSVKIRSLLNNNVRRIRPLK